MEENPFQYYQVESMYLEDMIKKYPDQVSEQDKENENENMDYIYIVVRRRGGGQRRMLYWKWGPEKRFFEHFNVLYEVITGKEIKKTGWGRLGMSQGLIGKLGELWETYRKGKTDFEYYKKGKIPKKNPNDDEESFNNRLQAIKDTLISLNTKLIGTNFNQKTNGLNIEYFVQEPNQLNFINIYEKCQLILNNEYDNDNPDRNIINLKDIKQNINRNNLSDFGKKYKHAMIDLCLLGEEYRYENQIILKPIDYIVAFIIKCYGLMDIHRNKKNSIRLLQYKKDNVGQPDLLESFLEFRDTFILILNNNKNYLNGNGYLIDQDAILFLNKPHREIEQFILGNYLEENYLEIIQSLMLWIKEIEVTPLHGIFNYFESLKDCEEETCVELFINNILKMSKPDRKLVIQLLWLKKYNPNDLTQIRFNKMIKWGNKKIEQNGFMSFDRIPYLMYMSQRNSKNKDIMVYLNHPQEYEYEYEDFIYFNMIKIYLINMMEFFKNDVEHNIPLNNPNRNQYNDLLLFLDKYIILYKNIYIGYYVFFQMINNLNNTLKKIINEVFEMYDDESGIENGNNYDTSILGTLEINISPFRLPLLLFLFQQLKLKYGVLSDQDIKNIIPEKYRDLMFSNLSAGRGSAIPAMTPALASAGPGAGAGGNNLNGTGSSRAVSRNSQNSTLSTNTLPPSSGIGPAQAAIHGVPAVKSKMTLDELQARKKELEREIAVISSSRGFNVSQIRPKRVEIGLIEQRITQLQGTL